MNNLTLKVLFDNGFFETRDSVLGESIIRLGKETQTFQKSFIYIEIRNLSNYVGRDWSVHIDNCDFQSIATVDIQTVEHFNNLMELMDIDFRLKINEK